MPMQLHYRPLSRFKKKHPWMFARKCIDGKLCENFAEYFRLLSHKKWTRNNSTNLNLLFVTSEFSKRSVYFSGAKLYNELPVQIWQLDSFEKFRNSANTILDWDRRHWIIAFLILYNINLKALRRGKMLSILILFYFISHVFVPFKLIFYPCNKKNWIFMREYFCLCTVT